MVLSAHVRLVDSSHVMRWCHAGAPDRWTAEEEDIDSERPSVLYPQGRTPDIAALEKRFDDKLGPHIRRWAYWQIFRPGQPSELATELLAAGPVAPWEKSLARPLLPVLRPLLLRALNISSQKAAESLARVEAIFEEVSDQLADGRPYLFGEHFCGADLTFAALGSFAVLPEEFWLVEREHLMLSRLHPQAQEQVICRFRAKRKAAYQSETLARQPRGAPGERVCDERGRERMPIEHSTEDRRIFLSSPPPPPRSIDYFPTGASTAF